jgi:predicted transcriptional regulator
MSDTERVRAWRQRLKDGGLVPMTIWVPTETKARYEDLALQSHRSVSELAQHALAAYRLDPSLVAAPITDTEQLQGLIRDEIDQAIAIVTATVTATITEAITAALPAMIETALQPYVSATVADAATATPQEPRWLATAEAFVSDMATDTAPDTAGSARPQAPRAPSVSDTDTATVTETTVPTGADPEATTETTPAPRGRRTARGPARRRTAPTRRN